MRTVHEVSKLTGVSVRTLHHYDAIGLLKPSRVTDAGYRLYDDTALGRLQNILLFRELQFSLKEIKAILDSPVFDPAEALAQQIRLLELRRKHLDKLISFARELQKKGGIAMNFSAFGNEEMDQYAAEVKERWGSTEAYAEYQRRSKEKSGRDAQETAGQLMELFAGMGTLRQLQPGEKAVQEKVGALQAFITAHYYTCTNEILSGLGQMYVKDERMKHSIDQAGGDGTAAFVSRAIEIYCSR